jgi:hypothetical protein
MTNEHIWELMQRDLDGDLSPEEQMQLHSCLNTDPDLQLMYGRLKKVSDQLEQLPPVTPAFSIVDSILPQLDVIPREPVATSAAVELPRLEVKKEAPRAESRKWKKLPVWMARAGSGLAAACLLLGLFFMVNGSSKNEPDTYTQGAEVTPAAKEQPVVPAPPVSKTDNSNHLTPSSEKPDNPATSQDSGGKGANQPEKPKQRVAPKPATANKKPAAAPATKDPKAKFPAAVGNQQTDKDDQKKKDEIDQAAERDHPVELRDDRDKEEKDRNGQDGDDEDGKGKNKDKDDDNGKKKGVRDGNKRK